MTTIPGIEFHGVIGSPVEEGGLLFIPALFDFDRRSEESIRGELTSVRPNPLPVREWLGVDDPYTDEGTLLVYWVRARLPLVFAFRPAGGWDTDRREILDVPFVAVRLEPEIDLSRAVPFICEEGPKGPRLIFRLAEEDLDLARRIASAFWGILLRAPQELAGFEEYLYDPEGYWYTVAFERGRLSIGDLDELDEVEDEDGEGHTHAAALRGERFPCPECDGTGIEHWEPYTDDCPTCGGTGAVTW